MAHAVPRVEGYAALEPLADGRSFEVFGATSPAGERVVVRVYGSGVRSRGPEAPYVQAGLMRLLRGMLPVPSLVEVGDGLLVTTLLPGIPLAEALEDASDDEQASWGAALGEVLGRLAGVAMSGPGGFMDDRLKVGLWEEGSESLLTWLDLHLPGSALEQLSAAQLAALRDFCAEGDTLLAVNPRAVLVHGDFTPRNVLCDPETGALTGIVDWEFAHAGHPVEDLGKLLRRGSGTPLARAAVEAMTPWLPAVEQADPSTIARRARAADLYTLIESASRRGASQSTEVSWALLDRLTAARDLLADA